MALVSSKAALGRRHGEAALTSSPPIIYQIQTPTLMLALDALTAMAGLRRLHLQEARVSELPSAVQ